MSGTEALALFLQLYFVLLAVVIANWVKMANEGKVSPYNISRVFFAASPLPLFVCFLLPGISKIFYIMLACLSLITAISVRIDLTESRLESFKAWMRVLIICLVGTYLCILLMDYSNFKKEFERLIIALFTFVCAMYYPAIMRRLRGD